MIDEQNTSILIVDDTRENLQLLVSMLSDLAYSVRPMPDGKMALAAARLEPPDLVLLDIQMPDLDGYEVCRQLKADPRTREIPVIFLSALDETIDKIKAFQVGGIDYITKPFQLDEVVARIDTHLSLRKLQYQLEQQNILLQKEREKSERLLRNILPEAISQQLKCDRQSIAEEFNEATILFADLVGFTKLAAQMSPLELVEWLNQIFSTFDRLVRKYRLEKIKTIGDAYMVVGGLPTPHPNPVEAIASLALAMQREIKGFTRQDGAPLQLRIGIHTGSVVAGVIGIDKFIYDLWGDTVNIASRLESQGEPDRIQVSASVRDRLKEGFEFRLRGSIPIRGRGDMETYWLTGISQTTTMPIAIAG
ncbi:MAG: response regulator [Cyanobacteria bacterium SBLK]|nr:response regulator [Cyanobacteria bacterium SBLK]